MKTVASLGNLCQCLTTLKLVQEISQRSAKAGSKGDKGRGPDFSDNTAWIPVQGTAPFALSVHLTIEARVSYIMSQIKRVTGYGEDLTEFDDCDPQIGVICSGHYR